MRKLTTDQGETFGTLTFGNLPLEKAVYALYRHHLQLVEAEELSTILMHPDFNSIRSQRSSSSTYISNAFVYLPQGQILVTSREKNPLINYEVGGKGVLYNYDYQLLEMALDTIGKPEQMGGLSMLLPLSKQDPDEARKSGVLLVERSSIERNMFEHAGKTPYFAKLEIPIEALTQEPLTRFLFGNHVEQFAEFLSHLGRSKKFSIGIISKDYIRGRDLVHYIGPSFNIRNMTDIDASTQDFLFGKRCVQIFGTKPQEKNFPL